MSYETILIDFKDLERPTTHLLHRKSVLEFNANHQLIGVVRDDNLQFNYNPFSSLIRKEFGDPLYWYYELLDPNEYLYDPNNPWPWGQEGEIDRYNIPFNNEQILELIAQMRLYGRHYPYHWTHLEVSDTVFAQGLLFIRPTDGGDNLKRSYMNGVSWLSAMIAAVGTSEVNLLGVAYIPGTDRLNT